MIALVMHAARREQRAVVVKAGEKRLAGGADERHAFEIDADRPRVLLVAQPRPAPRQLVDPWSGETSFENEQRFTGSRKVFAGGASSSSSESAFLLDPAGQRSCRATPMQLTQPETRTIQRFFAPDRAAAGARDDVQSSRDDMSSRVPRLRG